MNNINFSKNDLKTGIKVPNKLTEDLAYLIGIHVGDGSMNYYEQKREYILSYTGHLIDEEELYLNQVVTRFKLLLNKKPSIYKQYRDTTIIVIIRSKGIFHFFHQEIGLPKGSKSAIEIPKIIQESSQKYKIKFLKGIADTEFCLTFKKKYKLKHYYPVINYSTPNIVLINQVKTSLLELGFMPLLGLNYQTERNGKHLTTNQLELNGVKI